MFSFSGLNSQVTTIPGNVLPLPQTGSKKTLSDNVKFPLSPKLDNKITDLTC